MQDDDSIEIQSLKFQQYKLKVDDILKIDISSEVPEAAIPFGSSNSANFMQSTRDAIIYNGYQIDNLGLINLPVLGEVMAEGLTVSELRYFILNRIINENILVNPSVNVKILNSYFTILGEVNRPGKYDFLKNNLNFLEAIGMAGDLTINGKRKDIKLIRNIDNKLTTYKIDLRKSKFLFSPEFQVFSGDIIIVDPNTSRVKNAGIIGNSGTLLSLLSFILSSIIVIGN